MPITDLTGTTWLFNNLLDLYPDNVFKVNFLSNGGSFGELDIHDDYLSYVDTTTSPVSRVVVYDISWLWEASGFEYRMVKFTGGEDISEPNLISWLEGNATQITITDLKGYTWTANNIVFLSDAVSFLFDFTCNGHQYDELSTEYIPSPQETVTLYYDAQSVYTFNVGQQTGTWGSDAYKTFVITGGRDAVSTSPNFSTLLSFLYQRGTLTAPAPQLTVDLSTLLDWGSVATGSHVLTIKAKATGYRDGPLSTGVSFTKMAKLDTPGNVSVSGTEITFDEVENAESYDILVDGNSIGEYTPQRGYTINLRASNGSGAAPNANGGVKYRINGGTEGYVVTYNSNTTLENVVSLEVNCNWNGGFVNMLTDDLDGGGTEIASLDGDGNVWTNVSSHLATIAALSYAVIYCEA